jgi:thioesterase domain-containing protein/acyl carrier protein
VEILFGMGPAEEHATETVRAEITARIIEIWSKAIGRSDVDEHRDFFEDGGNYFLAPELVRNINKALGVQLTEFDLEQARTVAKVTDLVYFQQTRADRSTVVPLRNIHGSLPPIFLIHGVGGNILGFYTLAKCLESDQPVYAIQAQSLLPDKEAVLRLEEMAAHYIEDMKAVSPCGPYHLLGFSFGGLVAYEIAQQLRAAGDSVGLAGMLDTRQPPTMRESSSGAPLFRQIYWRLQQIYDRTYMRNDRFLYLLRRLRARILNINYRYSLNKGTGKIASAARDVKEINHVAGVSYTLKPYPGKVTLFRAEEDHPLEQHLPLDLGWGRFASGGLAVKMIPGNHGGILYEPGLSLLARELTAALREANAAQTTAAPPMQWTTPNTRRLVIEI